MNANIGDRIRTHGWQNLSKLLSVDEDGDLHTENIFIHRENLREVIANSFDVVDKEMNSPYSYIVVLNNGEKFVIHPSWVYEVYRKDSRIDLVDESLWVNVHKNACCTLGYELKDISLTKKDALGLIDPSDTTYVRTVPIDISDLKRRPNG